MYAFKIFIHQNKVHWTEKVAIYMHLFIFLVLLLIIVYVFNKILSSEGKKILIFSQVRLYNV